jgi:hypothetical protein
MWTQEFHMIRDASLVYLFLISLSGCSATQEVEPSGPIARLGSTPVIDGVFDAGEWDDAAIVRVDTIEQFRIKHDGVNLYFAVNAGGGNLVFNTDAGIRILHWSAQLGSAEYAKSDTLTQSLDKPYGFELWGLYEESPSVIQETLAAYLAEHGWAANTASMGELMQSELAISFDWLGVNTESGRLVELPSVRIGAGFLIARGDPRAEQLMALSPEEGERLYPPVSWPAQPAPSDSIGMGRLPETIRIDPADYGRIWLDLRR